MSPCHSTGFIERLSIELRRDDWSPFAIKGDWVADGCTRGDMQARWFMMGVFAAMLV